MSSHPVSVQGHTAAPRPVPPLTPDSLPGGVIGRFREVLQAQPEAVAVTDTERELTFAQVAHEAAQTLSAIRTALGSTRTDEAPVREPIALLHSHDTGAVCALLAILGSGFPVLVLDPRTPVARLKLLTERVGVRFCVADEAHTATAAELVAQVIRANPGQTPTGGGAEALWSNPPDPGSAAVLAFTSGSTGRPKVVINDHRMLVRDAWTNSHATGCYGPDDVIAHTLPMAFHAGLMATVAGLLVGCTMKLYDVRGTGITALPAWIEHERATIMHASPAILRAFTTSAPTPSQLRTLRSLSIAGEAAYARDVTAIRRLLPPDCTIRNRYGSSETGLIAEYPITSEQLLPDGALPTGTAVGDTVVTLLDETGRLVRAGETGTVTVTASHLATGYWNDPDTTRTAFTDNPDGTRTFRSNDLARLDPDGRLHLLGRRDHSIKIRGYLVEPAEIDAALFALDDIREALVVSGPRPGDGLPRLIAYLVSTAERPSAVTIRAALSHTLPGYMVPETIVFLDALPRTDRGKLDRSALLPPPATTGTNHRELSDWEDIVRHVWCQVLALPDIGLDDDFFELGGDSLAAQSLMTRMVSDLGVPTADALTSVLIQAPTLETFARRLHRKPDAQNQTLIPLRTTGSRPPLFIAAGGGGLGVAFVPIIRHLDPDQPVYALQAHALERRGLPDWSVKASARRHITSIRRIQPDGPYYLAGHSFGGLIALEIAHQLRTAGQEVALLIMLDSFPPDPTLIPALPPHSPLGRARELLSLATTGLRSAPGLDQYWRFYQQSAVLHRRYRCPPWPGPTLVILADSPEREDRARWAPHLTGPWRTVDVKGDHINMMRDPDAAETATAIGDALREAQLS